MGKHLSYAGRVELIRSVLYGMVQFWISIFLMSALVLSKINSLCCNFLWSGNLQTSHAALVAWKKVCLPRNEGGLALLDIKARNNSFLAKQLWNIHLKKDSLWIKWVDHYYLLNNSIWFSNLRKTSYPLRKSIYALKNQLVEQCGGILDATSTLLRWQNGLGSFIASTHEFFIFKSDRVIWDSVVWEQWSLLRYSFILWLVVLSKLRTRDMLSFISTENLYLLCRSGEKSHDHFFLAVNGTLYYGAWQNIGFGSIGLC